MVQKTLPILFTNFTTVEFPIELTSTRGKTFNHASNRNWDAVQAVTHDSHDGFLVLLEGTNKRAGKFYVWDTNPEGVCSGWIWMENCFSDGSSGIRRSI